MAFSTRKFRRGVVMGAIAFTTFPLAGCLANAPPTQNVLEVPANQSDQNSNRTSPADSSKASLSRPPAPPVGAYLGGIPPAVFAQLKDLPLMAPSLLTKGFRLVDHGIPDSGYYLIYRSTADQCFAIEYVAQEYVAQEYAAKGLSSTLDSASASAPLDVKLFRSPVFGADQKLFYGKVPPKTENTLVSQWLNNDNGSYRYLSGSIVTQNYPAQIRCASVSLEASVTIITSLASLTADPADSIGTGLAPVIGPVNGPSTGRENLSIDPEKQ